MVGVKWEGEGVVVGKGEREWPYTAYELPYQTFAFMYEQQPERTKWFGTRARFNMHFRRFLVVASWTGPRKELPLDKVEATIELFNEGKTAKDDIVDVVVAPADRYLEHCKEKLDEQKFALGTHDVPLDDSVADYSAEDRADIGCKYAILGHPLRRAKLRETDEIVAAKIQKARGLGMRAVVCVGELEAGMDRHATRNVVLAQLASAVGALSEEWGETDTKSGQACMPEVSFAYCPAWAVGTGVACEPAVVNDVLFAMRKWLLDNCGEIVARNVRLLYGGSVTKDNCSDYADEFEVDGFLVGKGSYAKEVRPLRPRLRAPTGPAAPQAGPLPLLCAHAQQRVLPSASARGRARASARGHARTDARASARAALRAWATTTAPSSTSRRSAFATASATFAMRTSSIARPSTSC